LKKKNQNNGNQNKWTVTERKKMCKTFI